MTHESIIDDEREEARSERVRFEAEGDPHPDGCMCSRQCRMETSGMTESEVRWGPR